MSGFYAPETETDRHCHVSLMRPMRVKLQNKSKPIVAFDGTFEDDPTMADDVVRYKTDRLYLGDGSEVVLKTTVFVIRHNIAGVVSQPFKDR